LHDHGHAGGPAEAGLSSRTALWLRAAPRRVRSGPEPPGGRWGLGEVVSPARRWNGRCRPPTFSVVLNSRGPAPVPQRRMGKRSPSATTCFISRRFRWRSVPMSYASDSRTNSCCQGAQRPNEATSRSRRSSPSPASSAEARQTRHKLGRCSRPSSRRCAGCPSGLVGCGGSVRGGAHVVTGVFRAVATDTWTGPTPTAHARRPG
jgi:hypothetical protein